VTLARSLQPWCQVMTCRRSGSLQTSTSPMNAKPWCACAGAGQLKSAASHPHEQFCWSLAISARARMLRPPLAADRNWSDHRPAAIPRCNGAGEPRMRFPSPPAPGAEDSSVAAPPALAQPPAAGPTEDDFRAWWRKRYNLTWAPSPDLEQTAMEWAAFCLDRWGRPAAVPAPGWLREDDPPRISPRADRIRRVVFNEGPVQRGQGNGGPSTGKPVIDPKGQGRP
jgi:hypothetical protein